VWAEKRTIDPTSQLQQQNAKSGINGTSGETDSGMWKSITTANRDKKGIIERINFLENKKGESL
jgi:hypothetical protein